MKIAIYTCNYGNNYRNEFARYYNVIFDEKIDYFLFTDKVLTPEELHKLKRWNVCDVSGLPSVDTMDDYRLKSKYVKFITPEKLQDYDIIVWIDNKRFNKPDKMNKITYKQIINILDTYPESEVFNVKHPRRKTIRQELIETIRIGYENVKEGREFLDTIKDFNSSFALPDTCVIIRKNTVSVCDVFQHCFDLMMKYKLKRDQNIYNFAFDSKNITPTILGYNMDILQIPRPKLKLNV